MNRSSLLTQAVRCIVKPHALCLTAAACLSAPAMGETIFQYNFDVVPTGTGAQSQRTGTAPSTLADGLSVTGSGIDTSNLPDSFTDQFNRRDNVRPADSNANYWEINGFYVRSVAVGQPSAKDPSAYLSLSFAPEADKQVTVEQLSFGNSRFGGAPGTAEVEVYVGGILKEASGAFTTNAKDANPSLPENIEVFNFEDFTTTEEVEFRLFGWNKQGTGTNSGLHIEDWTVTGSVSDVPEPSTLALAGLGLMAMLRRRR